METEKIITNKEKTLEFHPYSLVGLSGFKIKMTPKHKLYRKGMTEEELEGGFVITPDNICPNSWINKGVQVIDERALIIDSVLEGCVYVASAFSVIKGESFITRSKINVREMSIKDCDIRDFTLIGPAIQSVIYFKAEDSDLSGNFIFARRGWNECSLTVLDSKISGNLISRTQSVYVRKGSQLVGNIAINIHDRAVTFENSNIMGPKEFNIENEIINKVDLYE